MNILKKEILFLTNVNKKNMEKENSGIFFIADLHLKHENILRFHNDRAKRFGIEETFDIEKHDQEIIDMIHSQTKRGDHLYIVGDLVLSNQEESRKILHRIKSKGLKLHLIEGNHDKSTHKMYDMFESIDMIKVLNFHQKTYPFLEDELFQCVLCHYPILSWFNKARGSCMVHGHTHNNAPHENDGYDLRFNVGLDAPLSDYGLISLEKLYEAYRSKINSITNSHTELVGTHIEPKQYIEIVSKDTSNFIR